MGGGRAPPPPSYQQEAYQLWGGVRSGGCWLSSGDGGPRLQVAATLVSSLVAQNAGTAQRVSLWTQVPEHQVQLGPGQRGPHRQAQQLSGCQGGWPGRKPPLRPLTLREVRGWAGALAQRNLEGFLDEGLDEWVLKEKVGQRGGCVRPGGWGKQQVRRAPAGAAVTLDLAAKFPGAAGLGGLVSSRTHLSAPPHYWAWPGTTAVPRGSCSGTGVCCVLAQPGLCPLPFRGGQTGQHGDFVGNLPRGPWGCSTPFCYSGITRADAAEVGGTSPSPGLLPAQRWGGQARETGEPDGARVPGGPCQGRVCSISSECPLQPGLGQG